MREESSVDIKRIALTEKREMGGDMAGGGRAMMLGSGSWKDANGTVSSRLVSYNFERRLLRLGFCFVIND